MRRFAFRTRQPFLSCDHTDSLLYKLISLLLTYALVMGSTPMYGAGSSAFREAGRFGNSDAAPSLHHALGAHQMENARRPGRTLPRIGKAAISGPIQLASLRTPLNQARVRAVFQSGTAGFSSIVSNFNGTAIPAGDFIWFSSVFKASGLGSQQVRVFLRSASVQFSAGGVNYQLPVPDAMITFSPSATSATTTFDTSRNEWITNLPSTGLAGNTFLSGMTLAVPAGGLPGGINPVTWSGTFYSDTAGVSVNWQWAAAVYKSFSTSYPALGVKPVDDNSASAYQNSDHAGTPEVYKAFVTGGARGGGGSNYTGSYSATASIVPINQVPNSAPVANAGPAQTVFVGSTVQLDGSGSTDPDGDPLTYRWSFISVPAGSAAALTGTTTVKPTFVADVSGSYNVQLIVNDGLVDSAPSTVTISTTNSAPVANAGPNQSTFVNTKVFLDGSRSSDVDGDPITYRWSLTVPDGSSAVLSDPTAVNPSFTVDVKGNYVAQLIVNDGFVDSVLPSFVTVSTLNSPPVANPGPAQSVLVGTTVFLNGSGSSDVDGDPLTFRWSILNKPSGSNAVLSDGSAVAPTFFADQLGDYVVQLVVNDGTVDSAAATVTITTENSPPVANAGPAQSVPLGALVTLDGTASSDPDGQALTYQWSLLSTPTGSVAALADASSPHPTFTADVAGEYVAQLIVNDGFVDSTFTTGSPTVRISTINSIPVANAGPNRVVRTGVVVQLDGTGSSDADHDPLTYRWAITVQPSGSTATLSSTSDARPTFTPDLVGTYLIQLIVNDGKVDSTPATVTVIAQNPNQPPTVSAGSDQTIVLSTNAVTLNGAAADDGLPDGILLTHWSQVSGPSTAVFDNPDQPVAQVTFDVAGVYVLELSTSDTEFTSTSQVTITVTNPDANLPPFVDAGPDQTIVLPGIATFSGTVVDDGKPAGAPVTSAWKILSGPGVVIFSDPNSPQTTATASATGQYVLQLSGSDTQFTSTSNVNLIVTPPVVPNGNLPPVVSAGPNQTITLPTNTVTLNGSVADDGLPAGGTLTQFWTAISGPGTVTFGNRQAAVTTASFSAAGTYALRLTASDSELTASADAAITVNPDARRLVGNIEVCYWCGINFGFGTFQDGPIFVIHNTDPTTWAGGVLSIGPGGGFTDSFQVGTVPAGSFIAVAPGLSNDGGTGHNFFAHTGGIRDTSDVGPDADTTQFEFTALEGSTKLDTGVFTPAATRGLSLDRVLSINFLGLEDASCGLCFDKIVANISAGTVNTNLPLLMISKTHSGSFSAGQQNATYTVTVSNATGAATTTGQVTVTETTPPGLSLVSMAGSGWTCAANTCSRADGLAAGLSYPPITVTVNVAANATSPQVNRVTVDGGGSTSALATDATAITGAAKLPVVNAGPGQSIFLPPGTATLNGSGSSDNGPLTFTWSELSGPGSVTFSNPNSAVTQATFGVVGSYLLQLAATDGVNAAVSNTTVLVNTAINQPPVVSAGADQTIQLPANSATLNGTVSDDGLPTGSTVTVNWMQVSGPAAVIFNGPTQPVTSVSFPAPGTYTLRLTASDSQLFSSADVHVVVRPAPLALTASAGPDQAITLPANTVTMNGSAAGGSGPLTLAWSTLTGPAAVTFSSPNSAVTQATFSVAGTYILQLSATDGTSTASSTATVIMNAGPPAVSAGPDQTITLPANTATLSGSASSSSGQVTFAWSELNGPAGVTFSNPTSPTTQASFSTAGTYLLQLSANDTRFTAIATTTVIVNPDEPPPPPATAIINLPEGTEITSPTQITGTVSSGNWNLQYALASGDGTTTNPVFITFASGTNGINNGVLGVFDPTILLNGNYIVQLTATDQSGQVSTASSNVTVARNAKIGNFTLSFNDLTVPLPGLPITVTRTYDSREKRSRDFGVGWTLSISNVRLQKNGKLGANWQMTESGGFIPSFCLAPTKPHIVSITFADNRVYKFQASTSPQCQQIVPIDGANLTFTQMPGPANTQGASLQVVGDSAVLVNPPDAGAVDLLNFDTLDDANPTVFQLTTAEGFVYVIDQNLGVTSLTDPNGNRLVINANGVTSSAGKAVAFVRDGQGRITSISDPSGQLLVYSYSAAGDLASFTDRAGNTSTFSYDPTHLLTGVTDPRGVQAVRNTYDDAGRLLSTTDASGNTTAFTHDVAASHEIITDRLGNATLYEYDNDGNVLRITDPLGNVTSATFDANDNKLTETDALGNTTSYSYDALGDVLSTTDPLHRTTHYTYNSLRQPLVTTDPLAHFTTNAYDAHGNLLSTKDAAGNTTAYTYNAQGLPATVNDALGKTTSFAYDANGNLTQQTDALGNISKFTYDANGNKLTQAVTRTKADGTQETLTTMYQYDGNNRLVRTITPDGSSTQVLYNAIGKQSDTIDALGHKTHYDYDSNGRLSKTTYPDGTSETSLYDANDRRLSSTDRGGRITSYSYDALGRLTKTAFADNSSTQTVYDAAGRTIQTIDALNNASTFGYDAAGQRTSVTDALGHVSSFAYDAAGNQASMTDALNHTTQFVYDADNRRVQTLYPDQTSDSVGYDALGRQTSRTDQAGKVTQYGYDALGRLTSVKQFLNGNPLVTSYGYDELGNRISQTDANGHITNFAYDQLGRRTSRALPLGMSESYAYDAAGNLTAKTDFNGHTATYAYDGLNRLLSKTADPFFSSGSCAGGACGATKVSFTYSATGRRLSMADASGTTNYTYDNRDRLLTKASPFGTLTYTYDAAGNTLSLKSSNAGGTSMTYAYDALNRLASVTDPSGTTTYSYDAVGNLAGYAYPNGVSTSYSYDTLNRLASMESLCGSIGSAAALGCGNAGTPISSYAYTLGPSGNRLSVAELSGRTVTYGYDDLYRLTNETVASDPTGNNGAVSYTLDNVGNRLQRSSTLPAIPATGLLNYDANDRTATDPYDANGNLLSSGAGSNVYDFENRLVQAGGVSLVYDGDGNRVKETVGTTTTSYLVADQNLTGYAQVLDELQNGTVSRTYSYGLELINERQPISGTLTTSFYGFDGHGSVRFLTDSTGAITDTYDYDSFGNLISSTGTTPNNYLFAGEQFDPALGIYYNRARYYDERQGRFWTIDAFEGDPESPNALHRYLYASADPINRLDPTGNFDVSLSGVLTAVGVVATIIDAAKFFYNPTLKNGIWLSVDIILLPEAVIKAVTSAIGAGRLVQALNGIRSSTEAANDLREVRAFWTGRGFLKIARGEAFFAALGKTGKVVDAIIENPSTRNVILEEAKTLLRESNILDTIEKFKSTIGVIKSTGHGIEELYISAKGTAFLGQFEVRGGYLFFKNGAQVLVEGLPVAIRTAGQL